MEIKIKKLAGAIGAEISGLQVSNICEEQFEIINGDVASFTTGPYFTQGFGNNFFNHVAKLPEHQLTTLTILFD